MIKYTIKGRHVVIDPETLTVRAFNDIWNYDKTTQKVLATELLTYVFNMNDEREINPFRDADEANKERYVKGNAFGDENRKFNSEEQKLIDEATLWFNRLNSNSIIRLDRAADFAMDKVSTYLMNIKVETMQDVDDVMSQMKVLGTIVKGKKDLRKEAKEEMDKIKVKGGGTQSLNSKKLLDR